MYTTKKLLILLFVISSLPLFAQVNSTDSLNMDRASKADSLAQRYKNRTYKFDSALFYAKRAVAVRRKLIDRAALANSLIILGDVYETRKKYKEAVESFRQSARIAHQLRDLSLEKKAYGLLIRTNKKADKYKEALYYQGIISSIDDSIWRATNEQKSSEIIALQKQLEDERVRHENTVLKQQQEISSLSDNEKQLQALNEKYLRIAVMSASFIAVIFGLLLYRSYRLKKKLQRERAGIEEENKERVAISKDIREDFGLELSRINALSQEVLYKPTASETKKNISSIAEISNRLIENSRELVWQLSGENTSLPNLIGRLRDHCTDYLQDLPIEILFTSSDTLPDVPLKKMAYRNIFMAVKEALINIAKHARALNVGISVTSKGDYLNITVKDDGVGYDRSAEITGEGVKNMKTRIQSIGGLLNIVAEEHGTSVRMDIRLSQIVKH